MKPDITALASACPYASAEDQRKTAGVASRYPAMAAAEPVTGFERIRAVLRDGQARQAGFRADLIERFSGAIKPPVLFLGGEAHRSRRRATARFFAPRVVATRYRDLMTRTSARLVGRLRAQGTADLDDLSLELAVEVAADIVGLTDSDPAAMARRLDGFFAIGAAGGGGLLSGITGFLRGQLRVWPFLLRDVRPAIAARRREPREDVISHLLAEGCGERDILTECITYGAAGMATTREFITVAGWHLLEREGLRDRFLAGDEAEKIAILEEILRLEPVVGRLYRRNVSAQAPERVVALDIRSANGDEAAIGACPHALDPDRKREAKAGAAGLAFGDGEHRCPGASVAMHETMVFLDMLLRVPGIRLLTPPTLGWNAMIEGYELRGCRIGCAPGG